MKLIEINDNWIFSRKWDAEFHALPADGESVDFPFDFMTGEHRDYQNGWEQNSFYAEKTAAFARWLPALKKCRAICVYIDGLCGYADLYVNNVLVKSLFGPRHCVDITPYYEYGSRNMLRLNVTAPSKAGRYEGGGIAGGIALRTVDSDAFIRPDSLFLHSEFDNKIKVSADARIVSEGGEFVAEACIFNSKGRRVCRKKRKLRLKAGEKSVTIGATLARAYPWSVSDPYLYRCVYTLYSADGEKALDSVSAPFGLVRAGLAPKGLKINNRYEKLKGAVLMPDNGLLGRASYPQCEDKKLALIKEIGYNALRVTVCPTDALLSAADRLGLMLVVDLFSVLGQSLYPESGCGRFNDTWRESARQSVDALKNHPSVVMYSLCPAVPESYGRGNGYEVIKELAAFVRQLDPTRLITAGAAELVPTRQEMENAGGKISKIMESSDDYVSAAVSFGREKDLFKSLTAPYFQSVDAAGYCFLYPRYAADKLTLPDRTILGLSSYPSKAFDVYEEMERSPSVIGDFSFCAVDYLGEAKGKPVFAAAPPELIRPKSSYCGDIDITLNRKPVSYYKQAVLGDRGVCHITVYDPDEEKPLASPFALPPGKPSWNWPRKVGQNVTIEVFSGGDIVALYLGGKLIGRKLAGKINHCVATFSAAYYPGRLEAVSFHRGKEVGRCVLETVSAPRALKIDCPKTVKLTSGERLCFAEISVLDKEGRPVPHAMRDLEVTVEGDGRLLALGSADPAEQSVPGGKTCRFFSGKALAILKAQGEGKMSIKAVSEGILSAKAQIKIR